DGGGEGAQSPPVHGRCPPRTPDLAIGESRLFFGNPELGGFVSCCVSIVCANAVAPMALRESVDGSEGGGLSWAPLEVRGRVVRVRTGGGRRWTRIQEIRCRRRSRCGRRVVSSCASSCRDRWP